jgi:hypothetical protein
MSINISHCAKRIVDFSCSKRLFYIRDPHLPYSYTITYAETDTEYESRYNQSPTDCGYVRSPEEILQKLREGYCSVCGNKSNCMRHFITKDEDSKNPNLISKKLSLDDILKNLR